MLACRVGMLKLFGAEFGNVGGQFRIAVAKFGQLALVMSVDLGLDCVGAGHGSPFRHQGRRRAKCEAGDFPHRLQRCGPDAERRHQRIEALEVVLFLSRHEGDDPAGRAAAVRGRRSSAGG